jgi:sugar/nucleoside kinase (ribokinase family)
MKVSLYGHMIIDRIFDNFNQTNSIGGIANVWYSLLKINKKINVELIPCSIGDAIIIVDRENNSRIGRAIFNSKKNKVKTVKSEWSHIAYINQLENLSFIKKIKSNHISVDVSKESPEKVLKYLKYIDFLFISEEDLFMDFDDLRKICKGWVICHTPNGSIYGSKNKKGKYKIPKKFILNNINVLGAGDMFAGCFISNFLEGYEIGQCVSNSHKQTSKLLKDINK